MANRIVTYNEIIELMKSFVENHPTLNDFGNGPTSEIATSRKMGFPYMWSTHENDSQFTVNNRSIVPNLSFTLMFLDKVNIQKNVDNAVGDDSNNTQEVLSDCFQYAQDFLAHAVASWGTKGIKFNDDFISAFPIYDETTDNVSGWGLRISLKLTYYNC